MSQFELPDSWALATISEVAIKGDQRAPDQDETFTYVDIGSIDRVLKRISDPQILMGKNAPSRARKAIRNGDVLVSLTRPNLNAVALVTSEFDGQIASTGFEVIRPCLVDSRYIFGLTRSKEFIDSISGAVQGALYPAAKSSDVQGFKFPLPPLAEQKVIADKLDTLLAQVESIKARLERIPEILKQFRQSVLAAAVSGKLTEEWRNTQVDNLTWKETTLGRVILEGPQNGLYKPSSCYGSGVRIVRIDGFYDGELLDWETLKQVEVDDSEFQKWSLQPNDILVNRVNSIEYLGKSALVRNVPEPTVFESNIMRFSLNLDVANPEFISLFLCSSIGLEQLRKNAKLAVNQASINQGDVKSCLLNLPIINEQIEIVRRVKELFAYSNLLKQQVQSASDQVNNLTQSILAKAFRGELTAEWREVNLELISGENSAEALLGRIKAERELAKPATKRGRGKA